MACFDAPVEGRAAQMSLVVRPAFAAGGVFAGPAIDQAHLSLTRLPDTHPSVDTTVTFAVGADSMALVLKVPLASAENEVQLTVDLLAGETILFHGVTEFSVSAADPVVRAPRSLFFVYVGPGANAKTIVISPRDTSISVLGGLSFNAGVFDSTGKAESGVPVLWGTSNPAIATISGSGRLTGGVTGGAVSVYAKTYSGLIDSVHVTVQSVVQTVVSKLLLISGDGQSGLLGLGLVSPLVVKAVDALGNPVSGVTVNFVTSVAGALVLPSSAVTDANGTASTIMTLGSILGAEQFTAEAGSLAVTATESALSGAAAIVSKVSGDVQLDSLGALLQPFVVKVTDAQGNPSSGAVINWARTAGTGVLSAAQSTTNSSGLASTTYTLGNVVGTETVTAALAGTKSQVQFTANTIARGVSQLLLVSGDGQSGIVGVQYLLKPFVVKAVDVLSNPVAEVGVAFAALTSGAAVLPATATTGADGTAQTLMVLGLSLGTERFTAAVHNLTVTVSESALAGALSLGRLR